MDFSHFCDSQLVSNQTKKSQTWKIWNQVTKLNLTDIISCQVKHFQVFEFTEMKIHHKLRILIK